MTHSGTEPPQHLLISKLNPPSPNLSIRELLVLRSLCFSNPGLPDPADPGSGWGGFVQGFVPDKRRVQHVLIAPGCTNKQTNKQPFVCTAALRRGLGDEVGRDVPLQLPD